MKLIVNCRDKQKRKTLREATRSLCAILKISPKELRVSVVCFDDESYGQMSVTNRQMGAKLRMGDTAYEIEISDKIGTEAYLIGILAHELKHVEQVERGDARYLPTGTYYWKSQKFSNAEYYEAVNAYYGHLPWEREAFKFQGLIYGRII